MARLPKLGKRPFKSMDGAMGDVMSFHGGQLSVSFPYQEIERVYDARLYDRMYDLPIVASNIREELMEEGEDVAVGDFMRNHANEWVLQFYYGKPSILAQRQLFISEVNRLNGNNVQSEEEE